MDVVRYIDAAWEFVPALGAAGYTVSDFNEWLPAVHVASSDAWTYVDLTDRKQVESLLGALGENA